MKNTEIRNVEVFNKSTKETHITSERIAKDITKDKNWIIVNDGFFDVVDVRIV
jgi:cytochrome b involved in lipid metabolism